MSAAPPDTPQTLKQDLFGTVTLLDDGDGLRIRRDIGSAPWWTRGIAGWLMRREARALATVRDLEHVPQLLTLSRTRLERSYIAGEPMQQARPTDAGYFRNARQQLRALHRRRLTHNDLAKEPNWLVTPGGHAAIIDFQLAIPFRHRGRLFRLLAREDIRHLLKHKRSYCADALTAREQRILATPSLPSRLWMATVKPVYLFITRRLLGWSDREGAGDRGAVRQD